MDSDRGLQVFSLIPLIFTGYPGVFIQGFTDGNEAPSGCQTGFGSVIIPHNGKVWSSLQYGQVFKLPVVEAMNVSSASSQMPSACLVESETRIGPLTDPNLGGCIGPFPFVQNGLEFIGIGSGKFVNCPS